MKKYLFIILGLISLGLGLLGIVTPGLPTTPFILLTGVLFAKSSPRLHQKLLDNKYKDNPNQIFNLFESSKVDQYGNTTGTGLGLSIVQTIITEYNNSSIKIIEKEKGLGFKITFKTRQ